MIIQYFIEPYLKKLTNDSKDQISITDIEFLTNWFEASEPKFKAIWGTAVTEVGYKTGIMVKSVYEMSYKQGDSTVYVNQNYDTWIENGKVMAFWVNHRLLTENEVKALKK